MSSQALQKEVLVGDSNFGFKCFGVDELGQQGLSGVPGLIVRAFLARRRPPRVRAPFDGGVLKK